MEDDLFYFENNAGEISGAVAVICSGQLARSLLHTRVFKP